MTGEIGLGRSGRTSQAEFARRIGIKRGAPLNWEDRRRSPEGPARVLLALINKDPSIVQRTLAC